MTETIINRLQHRRILILGFGREGRSTLNFIRKHDISCQIAIADRQAPEQNTIDELRAAGVECVFGEKYLEAGNNFDLVLKTPGIPSRLIGKNFNGIISSQTDLFLEAFGNQTVGITGTKGKSTTSSLIHHILVQSGKHALLTGNIGIPCFDIVSRITPDTIVVFELSAHQLEFIGHSPRIGLLLNIFPEHLDHFGTFDRYAAAKCNIFRQMDHHSTLIIHSELEKFIPGDFSAQILFYDKFNLQNPEMTLRGKHFELLASAAVLAAGQAGVQIPMAVGALSSFAPLPHRLEPIGPVDGVMFVNDSIATVPQATLAAIEAWPPTFLILGGFDRGISYDEITKGLKHSPVPYVLLTGPAGQRMGAIIANEFPDQVLFYFEKLEEAFDFVASRSKPGDVVLLSPAAASYDRYLNFEHRGDKFRELALQFKRKNPDSAATGADNP